MEHVFLYIITWSWGHKAMDRVPTPSWQACVEIVETMNADISDGADTEAGIAVFCGGENMEHLNKANLKWERTEQPKGK